MGPNMAVMNNAVLGFIYRVESACEGSSEGLEEGALPPPGLQRRV